MVTGSRGLADNPRRPLIISVFREILSQLLPVEIIHGGASGPDTWAAQWAMEQGIEQTCVRPEKTPGRTHAQRLFDRNLTMVGMTPDILVVCWDYRSVGTGHAIDAAQDAKIPMVYVPVHLINNLY